MCNADSDNPALRTTLQIFLSWRASSSSFPWIAGVKIVVQSGRCTTCLTLLHGGPLNGAQLRRWRQSPGGQVSGSVLCLQVRVSAAVLSANLPTPFSLELVWVGFLALTTERAQQIHGLLRRYGLMSFPLPGIPTLHQVLPILLLQPLEICLSFHCHAFQCPVYPLLYYLSQAVRSYNKHPFVHLHYLQHIVGAQSVKNQNLKGSCKSS